MSPFNTCCKPPDNLPVFPLRRFEDIPDETRFKDIPEVQEEGVPDNTKQHFLRNRLILMSILALFVIFFQIK